uniref:Exocyst complex subunit EXOC6/Sec15 C-terminal domain-containing protein n=1 Tax=Bigelowiella natans TaxID=227086 RepID=A0A7S2KNV7_BIGNA
MMQGRLTGGRCFQARLLFRQTQSICEDTIFKLVNQKIQLLMALALDVDWAPSTPPISEPHDYVTDVITYLTTTFISLQKLPSSIRENVPVAGFTLITEYYMEIFSGISGSGSSSSGSGGSSGSRRACRFNMYGICNLSCDLKALEHFAKAQAVPNLHNAFRNIRQIVDMLLTGKILDLSSQIKLEMRTNFKNTEESDKIASIGEMKRLVMILGNYKTLKRKEANILPIEVRNLSSRDVSNAMKRLKAKIRAMEKRGAS